MNEAEDEKQMPAPEYEEGTEQMDRVDGGVAADENNDNAVMTQLDTERDLIGDDAPVDKKIHGTSLGVISDTKTEHAIQKSPIEMESINDQ